MDSIGWPYDSFDCLSIIQEFGTDCFRLVSNRCHSLSYKSHNHLDMSQNHSHRSHNLSDISCNFSVRSHNLWDRSQNLSGRKKNVHSHRCHNLSDSRITYLSWQLWPVDTFMTVGTSRHFHDICDQWTLSWQLLSVDTSWHLWPVDTFMKVAQWTLLLQLWPVDTLMTVVTSGHFITVVPMSSLFQYWTWP